MVIEFTCERCGKKFMRVRARRGGNLPRVCEACKAARAHAYKVAERRRKQAEEMYKRAAVPGHELKGAR